MNRPQKTSERNRGRETFEKCSILFKVKAHESRFSGISHRNILNISSPADRRDERNAEFGQISADFERGRSAKVSRRSRFNYGISPNAFPIFRFFFG